MTDEPDLYQPGDAVPQTGIYDAIHAHLDGHEHTPPHLVTASQGDPFPPCRACHEHVRFRFRGAAEPLESHHCFRAAAHGING